MEATTNKLTEQCWCGSCKRWAKKLGKNVNVLNLKTKKQRNAVEVFEGV